MTTKKKLILSNLQLTIPEMDKIGSLASWAHIASVEKIWNKLINHLHNPETFPKPNYSTSPDPCIDFIKSPKCKSQMHNENIQPPISPSSPP